MPDNQAEIDEANREPELPRECCPMCRTVVKHLLDENGQIRCYNCGQLSELDDLITEDDDCDCGWDL